MQFQHLTAKASHVRSKHGPPEKQAECRICHKTYKKSYLKEHIASHSSSDARKCSECGKTFSSRSNLTKHRKKHLPGYVPNSKRQREKKYCCHEEGCEKRFDSSKALEVCVFSLLNQNTQHLAEHFLLHVCSSAKNRDWQIIF